MKKAINHYPVIILLIVIVASFTIVGCGNQTTTINADTVTETAIETVTETVEEIDAGEETTTPEIKTISTSDAVTCGDVDANSKPLEITDTFDTGIKIIHLAFNVHNFTTKDQITAQWNYLETGEIAYTANTNPPMDGEFNNIEFYLSHDQGLPSGKYNIEIYLNGDLSETVEFSIK
ncbi:MAG: hypothetical protein MUP02_10535 [Actinobacteria bacterium]|nr:hypothetical protein [Actinomycetota bacterium]